MKKAKIPKTDSIRELAEFCDTHDSSDFEDQLEELDEPVFERGSAIKLHLPSRETRAVAKLARNEGVSPEELIRGWVRQKLNAS